MTSPVLGFYLDLKTGFAVFITRPIGDLLLQQNIISTLEGQGNENVKVKIGYRIL